MGLFLFYLILFTDYLNTNFLLKFHNWIELQKLLKVASFWVFLNQIELKLVKEVSDFLIGEASILQTLFSEISHCKNQFCNVYVKLYEISIEVVIILKQNIIKLVKLGVIKSIRDMSFSSTWINIRTRSLISCKSICELTKYISQLLISIIALIEFWSWIL